MKAHANPITLKAVGGFFFPADSAFREIYGSGDTSGLELTIELFPNLDFWMRANYFFKRGQLTLTREPTQVEIVTMGNGLRYRRSWKKLFFYGGIGTDYFIFNENNVLGNIEAGNLGLTLKAGVGFIVWKGIVSEFCFHYSRCQINPADYEVNIGGFQAMFGLGYRF
ncbi:MAG: hypothetical protein N3B16_02980 [Candidatus Aminicenantes bacterium]|nr:hypothetical protein [Candidatus Aminicenantes bacterium]